MEEEDSVEKCVQDYKLKGEYLKRAEFAEKHKLYPEASELYELAGNLGKALDMVDFYRDENRTSQLVEKIARDLESKGKYRMGGIYAYNAGLKSLGYEIIIKDGSPKAQETAGNMAEEIGSTEYWRTEARKCFERAKNGYKEKLDTLSKQTHDALRLGRIDIARDISKLEKEVCEKWRKLTRKLNE